MSRGFEKPGKMDAVKSAQRIYTRCKNPFEDRHRI